MSELTFLNKKERQKVFDILETSYGFSGISFFDNFEILSKDIGEGNSDIFLINRKIDEIEFDNLRLDSIGLFFGSIRKENFFFSIDGSFLVGKLCKKNIFNLDKEKLDKYILGEDVFFEDNDLNESYVLLRYGEDYFGSAKLKKDGLKPGLFVLQNMLPKERRVSSIVSKNTEEVDNLDYEENIIDL